MCNLFLADEINRTSPKTQSALLEVMEEGNVTVDGISRKVPEPFIVMPLKIQRAAPVHSCCRSHSLTGL